MLFPISANKHEYTQVNGLNVDEPNEKIKGLLNFITVPDRNQIDFNAFNIVQEAARCIKSRAEESKKRSKEMDEWKEKFLLLSEEKQQEYEKNGYLEDFPVPPKPIELYDGVLIGEDVPNWLSGSIVEYCFIEQIPVYFNFHKPIYGEIGKKDTNVPGVSEIITGPTGHSEHHLFVF